MLKILPLTVLLTIALTTAVSCSHAGTGAADTVDSLHIADSLRQLEALRSDSIAMARADSLYRDSVNRNTISADLIFADAHGAISAIIYHRSCEWTGSPVMGELRFDESERLIMPTVRRSDGHITAMGSKSYGWSEGRISLVGTAEFGNNEDEYRALNRTYLKHHYDSRGRLERSESMCNMDDLRILYTYCVTDTDSYGNWLARTVTRREVLTGSGEELHREDIPELRTIIYFTGDTLSPAP